MAAQLGGLDLGHGHRLARFPQLALQPELLLGALAQLGGDVSAVLPFALRELRGALLQPLGHLAEGVARTSQGGKRFLLQGDPSLELLAIALALFANSLGALDMTALGGQFRLQLGALDRGSGSLPLALGLALGQPARPARLLRGLVQGPAGLPNPPLGFLLAGASLGQRRLGPLEVPLGPLLGLLSLGQPGGELLSLGARRERGVGPLAWQPADLAGGRIEAFAVDRDRDAGEALGDLIEIVDQPGIGEQALGDGRGFAASLDQIEQAAGTVLWR